jgi:hypothetical protein
VNLEQAIEIDLDAMEVDVDMIQMQRDKIFYAVHQRLLQLRTEHALSTKFVEVCLLPHISGGLDEINDALDEVIDEEDFLDIMAQWEEIVYNPSNVGGLEN